MSGMSWLELAGGTVCLLVIVSAARRGFLREGSLLVGLAIAIWLSGQLYRPLGLLLLRQPERGGPWAVVLYVGLALVLLVAMVGLSALASPLVRRGLLLHLDRAAGALIGAVEATLAVGLLALSGERMGFFRPAVGSPIGRAAELTGASFMWVAAAVPPDVLRLANLR